MCYNEWFNCEILQVSKDHAWFRFPSFLPYIFFFFFSRSQDLALHFSQYVCLDSSWPWQLLRFSLFLLTLTVLKSSHQACLENFPQLAFFFFFGIFMSRRGLRFWKGGSGVKCPSRHISRVCALSMTYKVEMDLHPLAKVTAVRFVIVGFLLLEF